MTTPIWLKDIECKCCGAKFKTPRLKPSALVVKNMDSDFHKTYDSVNPMFYAITTCSECNYSARNEDFEKVLLEYHPEIMKLAQGIKTSGKIVKFSQTTEVTLDDAVNKHLLAIAFYKCFKPENQNTISGLYMHLTWMYREVEDVEKEKVYLAKSLEYYIKTYEKGSFVPEKLGEPGIIYMIGELNRRLCDNIEAVKWFARAVQHQQISNFSNIENLARDGWEKITQEKRK